MDTVAESATELTLSAPVVQVRDVHVGVAATPPTLTDTVLAFSLQVPLTV